MSDGIKIKVTRLGGQVNEFFLPVGSTVAAALRAASVTRDGHDVRVGGETRPDTFVLSDNQTLILVPSIKAGN